MPKVEVEVLGDVSSLGRSLKSGAGMVRGFASSTGSVLKGVLGANLITAGAGAAVDGLRSLGGALKDSVGEAREAEVVGKTTAAVIKATGGAAKITADEVGALAASISNKTGVDDEAIQSGQNLLLTFKQVRNEAGKGNQIFDRASAAAVDLSKTGFGSIESSSKMLGKALNDPAKGITALSRAGVTFTDKQKATIQSLTKTGDLLGAQKIILGEVESQVGGVAAANATAGEKAAVMAGNLKEQFGTALLPSLDRLAGFFTSTLGPAISSGIEQVAPGLQAIGDAVAGGLDILLKGDFTGFGDAFKVAEDSPIVDFLFNVREGFMALPGLLSALGAAVGPSLGQLLTIAQMLAPALLGIVSTVGPAILGALTQVRGLAIALLPILLGIAQQAAPLIAGIVTQIGGLIASVLPQITGIATTLGGVIAAVLPGLLGVVSGVVSAVQAVAPIVLQVFGAIATAIQQNLPAIQSAIGSIREIIGGLVSIITSLWTQLGPTILPIVTSVFGTIVQVISGALKIVSGIVKVVSSVMKGDWSGAWNGMKQIVSGAWQIIKAVVLNAGNVVRSIITNLIPAIRGGFSTAWNGAKAILSAAWAAIVSIVKSKASALLATVQGIPGRIKGVLGNLGGMLVNSGKAMIDGLARGIRNGIDNAVGAAKDAVARIRAFFPGSPAKRGPFSGKGWTLYSGRAIGAALGEGMDDSRRAVIRSASSLVEAASVRAAVRGATALPVASVAQRQAEAAASAAAAAAPATQDLDALTAAVRAGLEGYLRSLDPRGAGVLVATGQQFNRSRGGAA